MSLRRKVLHGLFWTGGTRLIGQGVTWLITIVVIRILSPDDYGLLALATVFVGFAFVLSEAGLGAALVQTRELDDSKLRAIFAAAILINGTFTLLLIATAPAIAHFFSDDRLVSVIRALSAQFVFSIFTVIPTAILTRALDFKRLSLVSLIAALCGSFSTLALALSDYGVWSLVAGSLVAGASNALMLNFIAPFLRLPDFSLAGTRRLLFFGGQVTGARLLWYFYSQADVLIAGKLLGRELLGFYSVAMQLASLPVQKFSSVINQVALPAFAQTQHDPQLVARHLLKCLQVLCLVAIPIFWGISSVAEEIVDVFLGRKWQATVVPLQLLSLVMPLSMISSFLNTAFHGLGHGGVVFKNVLTASLILPLAFLIGANWELRGLSLAWVVGFPLVLAVNLHRMLPLVGLRVGEFVATAAPAALSGCGMYVAVMLTRYAVGSVEAPIRMLVLVGVGVVAYSGLAWLINKGGVRELAEGLRPRADAASR